ncbi:MAG: dTMP kinase [Actinomycetes bacterium]|jgi:dTMP kinase
MSARGRFVVLEGCDGCGKTTQVARLVRRLEAAGLAVRATFEPGATELGRSLRAILLDGDAPVDPRAEALLMAADRAQHVGAVVEPSLAAGTWVVSDRYVGSSLAYQGGARGLGVGEVAALSAFATGGLVPDLVVYLAAPVEVLATRRRGPADRIEGEGDGFLAAVVASYDRIATDLGWTVVDGTGSPDEVEVAVWTAVDAAMVR